ncbi:MAG: restriction endonuclease subunit S, partial [Azoarcus sp.]
MGEFPASWLLLPVSEVVRNVTLTDKKIPQKRYLPSGKFPVFDQGQEYVGGYTDDAAMVVDCDLPVIVFGDHTRVVKLVNTAFAPGADGVKVLQPSACILPKLLEHFVRYLVTKIPNNGYARHYQHLARSLLPIPPLAEQHRIVAKIEELFSELDQGVASLKKAREQLKVYRQSLLKNAFEGKLTAAWRAAHRDQLETAAALQQRIARERQARYQQQLADWETAGQAGPKPKPPKHLPPLTAEELAELPELPAGWAWIRLGATNVAVFDGPFGSNLKSSDYVSDGVRVIRLENIGAMEFIEDKLSFITPEKYQALEKHTVFPGDLVFSSFVTENVRVAMVPPSVEKAVNKADCFCIRLFGESLLNSFALNFLATRSVYKRLEEEIHGVGRPRINTTQLKNVAIPVCSTDEQRELVAL